MYYEGKDSGDCYFRARVRHTGQFSGSHHFRPSLPRIKFTSRKVQLIKVMIKAGVYETEEKIRIAAANLLRFLEIT